MPSLHFFMPKGPSMRWAKSYSIVDHQLLHGGFLKRLSHPALALYLFLVVVGDCEGKSLYAPTSIMNILRFDLKVWTMALKQLLEEKLIAYRRPYFWVLNLEAKHERVNRQNPISQRRAKTLVSANRKADWHHTQEDLQALCRKLAAQIG